MITPDVRLTGTVQGYQSGRGYGFIRQAIRGRDVFFDYSDVMPAGDLQDGDGVSYDLEERDGRLRAVRVRLVR